MCVVFVHGCAAAPVSGVYIVFICVFVVCKVQYSTVIIVSRSTVTVTVIGIVTVTVVFIYFKVVYLRQDYLMPSNL